MTGEDVALSVVVPTRDRPGPLAACLAALEAQTAAAYEIVVVDDASVDADGVAAVVAATPRARYLRGDGRGPAAARNLGARAAAGAVVCFTDDDCRPQAQWLAAIAAAVDDGAQVVAGPTRNGRPDDALAAASQAITNHLCEASLDPHDGTVGFAPTSNVACRVEVHRDHPFDESYPLAAGEDRAWCSRLAAHGVSLHYVPEAVVDHHQDLSGRGFWRQQVRYGRGARRWHEASGRGERLQPVGFYVGLVRRAARDGYRVAALVVLAQVATAVGLVAEAWSPRRPQAPRG